jgi:hypothetical protein
MPQFIPRDKSAQRDASDRLESWKEIAAHLNRTVRTAQRWERSEGLPVHRHQHEERASVYASKSEIDAWWKTRRIQLDTETDQQGIEQAQVSVAEPDGPTPARKVSHLYWSAWATMAATTAIIALLLHPWNRQGRTQLQPPASQTTVASGHSSLVTVAVLPFKNLSGNRDIDYLRIALPDQISKFLSYSSGIAVRPFASTEKYAGGDLDPQAARSAS